MQRSSRLVSAILALLVLSWGLGAPCALAQDKGLVGKLTKGLGVTPEQATGGAGAIFGYAKGAMDPADFSKVAAAVPGMDKLLKAAPAAAPTATAIPGADSGIPGAGALATSAAGALPGAAGGLGSLVGPFNSLGMKPEMIAKFVPILVDHVKGRGGDAASGPLGKVLGVAGPK